MPHIFIPSLLRGLAGGAADVTLPGATVREVIDALDAQYPGIKARLMDPEQNRIRRNIAVVVDGVTSREGLRQKLDENSEVHFVPAISGGAGVAPLSQRDPRWANEKLGLQNVYTIGTDGCALTCLTMLANRLGYAETPITLNEKMKTNGGFLGALAVWAGLERALPGMKAQGFVLCRDYPAPLGELDASLLGGRPVLVELDQSPVPGLQTHWVLLYAKQGDDYLIYDPWSYPVDAGPVSLLSRYGTAAASTAAQVITAIVIYDRPGWQASAALTVQMDPDVLASGGLPVRSGAGIANPIVARLLAGGAALAQETPADVAAKVGVYGAWLNVQTQEGQTGFAAAWLMGMPNANAPRPATRGLPGASAGEQPPLREPPARAQVRKQRGVTRVVARMAASQTARVIGYATAGSAITLAEPTKTAQTKLGQPGAWVRVQTNTGRVGYIRADWLVEIRSLARASRGVGAATPASASAITQPAQVEPDERPLVAVMNHPDVVAAGGLKLRVSAPGGAVLRQMPPGTRLYAREPRGVAEAKIGVNGQWLSVCAMDGVAGFCAAWYAQKSLGWDGSPPPASAIAPEIVAQGVVLAASDAPLLSAPNLGAASAWRVAAGTPLRVAENGDWASKVGKPNQFIHVETFAFKRGYAQGSLLRPPAAPDTRQKAEDAPLPFGETAWIYGMHDPHDRAMYDGSGKHGWCLYTETVGGGQGRDYDEWSSAGHGVIARLNNDYGGSGTIPTPDRYDWFAQQCAAWARNSKRCHIWVIGNEMNNPREWPNQNAQNPGNNPADGITPERYAACFNKVYAAIHAIQPNAIVVPGAVDPYNAFSGNNLSWFTRMLAGITALDGLALHTYTHGSDPALVTSPDLFDSDPLRWQYYNFWCYLTYLDVIPARWRDIPVFITESNAGWNANGTQPPWSGGQNGWVQAALREVDRYNNLPHAQQIRALILYRWQMGGGADAAYAISQKPGAQADYRAVLRDTDLRWRK